MKRLFLLSTILLTPLCALAQTEVTDYVPGVTAEGITYFLPQTRVRVVVTATKKRHVPGEFCEYAARFLRLNDVTLTAYDEWHITSVKLCTYGTADKTKAYSIRLKSKTSAPYVQLTPDGRLLSVNAASSQPEQELPVASVTRSKEKMADGSEFKTEEILSAGSTSKMAELAANEIYDIRESRSMLAKGQADFMPTDGEQLKLMLASLDAQEEGLLQLFEGSATTDTHVFTFDLSPTADVDRQPVFNFSKYLGVVDADDPAGKPVYFSLKDLKTLPAEVVPEDGKKPKEVEDLRYVVPGSVRMSVFTDDEDYVTMTFPMAQFGRVEHLGGELFNKKATTHVQLSPVTGGIVKIEAAQPE